VGCSLLGGSAREGRVFHFLIGVFVNLVEQAKSIVDQAFEEHDVSHAFVLTSGGNDSIVPLHIFKDDDRIVASVHIDTGIRVPETEDHVRRVSELFNVPLLVYRALENRQADGTPDPQVYEEIVKQFGFPGPSQHLIMYSKLKERQVRRLVRDHKVGKKRIMLITGVRKSESGRRSRNVKEIQRQGVQLWVAPVANWTDSDMALYREHHSLPKNPVADKLGMSGECLCGAYAKPGELDLIARHYPKTAEYIRGIEKTSGCPWRWEDKPTASQSRLMKEIAMDNSNMHLCTSCISRGKATQ